MAPRKRYVVGYVGGQVLVQGDQHDDECCELCGAATHRGRPCRRYGAAEEFEGHRGDEGVTDHG